MSARELAQQQVHPRPPPLTGRAQEITRARLVAEQTRVMELMRRAEFLENMRESRLIALSDWQMNERDLVRSRAAMGQLCQKWAAEVKMARRDLPDEAGEDWSVLEDAGTVEVIPDSSQAIEEQALEE